MGFFANGVTPKRRTKPFLKGPVPWDWLKAACKCSGSARSVALALWYQAGRKRSRTVRLSRYLLEDVSLNRMSANRGLAELEAAGLVDSLKRQGRSTEITLLDAPP